MNNKTKSSLKTAIIGICVIVIMVIGIIMIIKNYVGVSRYNKVEHDLVILAFIGVNNINICNKDKF